MPYHLGKQFIHVTRLPHVDFGFFGIMSREWTFLDGRWGDITCERFRRVKYVFNVSRGDNAFIGSSWEKPKTAVARKILDIPEMFNGTLRSAA